MKVFIDTNVWVASYTSQGLCREFLVYVRQRHRAILSEQVLEEYTRILIKKMGLDPEKVRATALDLRGHLQVLPTPSKPLERTRDPKDDAILQAALDGDCDWLVSGDKDLTSLKRVKGMPINTPRDFMEILGVAEEYI